MKKKVLICAGGTGGHLFPAQALALQLREKCPSIEIQFMAKGLNDNKHFRKDLFSFLDVASGTISKNPLKLVQGAFQLTKGVWQSLQAMRKRAPDLVIGFGSYHTLPVLFSSVFLQIPLILHESNSIAGKANRLFSKRAEWTGLFFPDAKSTIKGASREVNIPLRKEFESTKRPTKNEALAYYGLHAGKKTILVFGGSQGAQGINQLFLEALCHLKNKIDFQVLHLTGSASSVVEAYKQVAIEACVKEFEPKMHYALSVADLAICRAGASTIAELIAFQLPAIFIPYPHASDNHQEKNAEYVEKVIQGGKTFLQRTVVPAELAEAVISLLEDKKNQEIKAHLARYFEKMNKSDFCDEILKFLKG